MNLYLVRVIELDLRPPKMPPASVWNRALVWFPCNQLKLLTPTSDSFHLLRMWTIKPDCTNFHILFLSCCFLCCFCYLCYKQMVALFSSICAVALCYTVSISRKKSEPCRSAQTTNTSLSRTVSTSRSGTHLVPEENSAHSCCIEHIPATMMM